LYGLGTGSPFNLQRVCPAQRTAPHPVPVELVSGPGPHTSIAWTGHRPDLFADPAAAQSAVNQAARDLLAQQPTPHFLSGGQRGVDTWAALAALQLGITYSLILPLDPPAFAADWTAADRLQLDRLIAAAHHVTVVGGQTEVAYSERNRLLVSRADLLVAVWTRSAGGGTAETLAFARDLGMRVNEVVLDPSPNARSARGRGI
jgi:uncharacterized phage-like protein YoqJ